MGSKVGFLCSLCRFHLIGGISDLGLLPGTANTCIATKCNENETKTSMVAKEHFLLLEVKRNSFAYNISCVGKEAVCC